MREFLTKDKNMLNLLKLAENVAPSKSSILILGESGVGKEQLAQWIHSKSHRSLGSFVALNCAAVPKDLLESELFGCERGAFTGAVNSRAGQIEQSHGGTFLLDEISEMSLDLQGKLLRVIQEKEVQRLGGNNLKKIDTRFICTSNKDLKDMVQCGLFRKDLFYRINVVPIRIPTLQERPDDIQFYAELFIEEFCNENKSSIKQLDNSARNKLASWNWPGNVRELKSTVERSLLMSSKSILSAEDIQIDGYEQSRSNYFGPGMTVQEAERLLILKTLQHTNDNRTMAAKLLGISIRTLRNKLNEYKSEAIYE